MPTPKWKLVVDIGATQPTNDNAGMPADTRIGEVLNLLADHMVRIPTSGIIRFLFILASPYRICFHSNPAYPSQLSTLSLSSWFWIFEAAAGKARKEQRWGRITEYNIGFLLFLPLFGQKKTWYCMDDCSWLHVLITILSATDTNVLLESPATGATWHGNVVKPIIFISLAITVHSPITSTSCRCPNSGRDYATPPTESSNSPKQWNNIYCNCFFVERDI